MPAIHQPTGMMSADGAILTIGIGGMGDYMTMVMPFAHPHSSTLTPDVNPGDLLVAAQSSLLALLCACMSSDAYISFIQAEGMMDGAVPGRDDFLPGAYPGVLAGGVLPDSCASLVAYYADPADLTPGSRMRVAKSFVPGIPKTLWLSGNIDPALQGALDAMATVAQNGFPSILDPSEKWYRVLASPKVRNSSQPVKRIIAYGSRGYVGTQRRRVLPHI